MQYTDFQHLAISPPPPDICICLYTILWLVLFRDVGVPQGLVVFAACGDALTVYRNI